MTPSYSFRELLPTKDLIDLNVQINHQYIQNSRRNFDIGLLHRAIELSHYAATRRIFELGIGLSEVRICSFNHLTFKDECVDALKLAGQSLDSLLIRMVTLNTLDKYDGVYAKLLPLESRCMVSTLKF